MYRHMNKPTNRLRYTIYYYTVAYYGRTAPKSILLSISASCEQARRGRMKITRLLTRRSLDIDT